MFDVYFKVVILSIDYSNKKIGVWLKEDCLIPERMAFPKTFQQQLSDILEKELGVSYTWVKPKQFTTILNDNEIYIAFVGMCPSDTVPLVGKLVFDYDNLNFNTIDKDLIQKARQWIS